MYNRTHCPNNPHPPHREANIKMTPHFSYLNHPSSHLLASPLPHLFVLTALPETDIWKKPPSHSSFSAPIAYTSLPLSSFKCARVTVVADWKTLYDQGGLCLILPEAPKKERAEAANEENEEGGEGKEPRGTRDRERGRERRWIKTGVEFFKGAAHVSAVACDRWADWSIHDHPPLTNGKVTMEIEREVVPVVDKVNAKNGEKMRRTSTLWIYVVEERGGNREKRRAVREVSWVFEEDVAARNDENEEREVEEDDSRAAGAGEQRECWVGVYAAKPNKNEGDEEGLEVVFEGLEVETF